MDIPSVDLAKRRDRAIAAILSFKEDQCDPYLPRPVSARLRKIVLDQLNEFFVVACTSMAQGSYDPNVILNEHYLQKINELHDVIVGEKNGRAAS
jgi:hypothetical protein